ncbi:UPF0764 protein C16orf89 homolog isoform X2 [Venturia canescens]|nr:UPF0764 protein C16orf89 homolog isoform X2 [Venturia canescens]
MYERPGQMNVDAIFGLNLAQVHVGAVLEHENAIFLTEKNRITLQVILTLCQIAENDGKKLVKASGLEMMIRTEVWNRTIFWRLGELGERPSTSAGLSEAEVPRLFYQGSPSESESLRCFIDLLVRDENRICRISKECAEMLERNDCSRGYPLTHRILYAQLATALGCQTISLGGLESMKKAFCTTVLQDLVDLESMNFPFFSRDLAMEQIAVCGMNGYLEFTNERYAKLITSWPNSHGCFSAFGFGEGDEKKRGKRSTSKMDYGCDNHASGVAAACLSLLIRSAVENLDPLFF